MEGRFVNRYNGTKCGLSKTNGKTGLAGVLVRSSMSCTNKDNSTLCDLVAPLASSMSTLLPLSPPYKYGPAISSSSSGIHCSSTHHRRILDWLLQLPSTVYSSTPSASPDKGYSKRYLRNPTRTHLHRSDPTSAGPEGPSTSKGETEFEKRGLHRSEYNRQHDQP